MNKLILIVLLNISACEFINGGEKDLCEADLLLSVEPNYADTSSIPNIVLVVSDDLGQNLSLYNDNNAMNGTIDELGRQGVYFSNAYVTQASCSSSRSSILTGLYPHQNGQIGLANHGFSMKSGIPNISSVLVQHNYKTGIIGKLHVNPAEDFSFDYDQSAMLNTRDIQETTHKMDEFLNEFNDSPFFLMVNALDPHRPFMNRFDGLPKHTLGIEDVGPLDFLGISTPAVLEDVRSFYNSIQRLNNLMGSLVCLLDEYNELKNTYIIFVGDHGPPFNRAKTTCYEAGIKIPFVIWHSSLTPKLSDEFVSTLDLFPTILEIANIDSSPYKLEGKSLLAHIMRENDNVSNRSIFAETNYHSSGNYFPRRSVRKQNFKLIYNHLNKRLRNVTNENIGIDGDISLREAMAADYDNSKELEALLRFVQPPKIELYDLIEDPFEFTNLAENTEYSLQINLLLDELIQWQIKTGDTLQIKL